MQTQDQLQPAAPQLRAFESVAHLENGKVERRTLVCKSGFDAFDSAFRMAAANVLRMTVREIH